MNNIGNIKDTIPITKISNFPIPIWDNVKAKISIIFDYNTSLEINNRW